MGDKCRGKIMVGGQAERSIEAGGRSVGHPLPSVPLVGVFSDLFVGRGRRQHHLFTSNVCLRKSLLRAN